MEDVKIDSKLFQERVSQLASAWKKDLPSGPSGVFAGAGSILIMSGSGNALEKNIAIQVTLYYQASHFHFIPLLNLTSRFPADSPSSITLDLVVWLRVPIDLNALHARHPLCCHHSQERYVRQIFSA